MRRFGQSFPQQFIKVYKPEKVWRLNCTRFIMIQRIIFITLLSLLLQAAGAQYIITGSWYGRGESKAGLTYNSYLCELMLLKKGNNISGTLNYYFGQHQYSTPISGVYWPATGTIEFNPFSIISFFAKDNNGPDCQMDGSLTLYTNGPDSLLYGQLNPVETYQNGCPVITVSLKKSKPQPTAINKKNLTGASAYVPVVEVNTTGESVIKSPPTHPLVAALNERNFTIGPLIEVETDTIMLHLYDNGKMDFDTVSVFFNRQPIAEHQLLGLTPIVLPIVLAPGENEIALFAENLGEIPPNTALCIVYAGKQRYDLNLSSSLATNGTIRIKRRAPAQPR